MSICGKKSYKIILFNYLIHFNDFIPQITMSVSTETTSEIARLRKQISAGEKTIALSGLTSTASKAFVLSKLQNETNKTFVIIADSNKELENWECDLSFWDTEKESPDAPHLRVPVSPRLLTLPSFETDIYSGVSPHAETQEKRALALWHLAFQKPDFLIVSAKSLITKTPAPNAVKKLGANLKLDEDFPPADLIEKLIASGYVRDEPIKNIGEFSVRGGILDVWSPTQNFPVRIEFFGDTVDSIREFDAETQLSVGHLKEISIAPMREFAASDKDFKVWAELARERFSDEKFARNLKDRTDFADEGEDFSGWEFLFPLVQNRNESVFDFLTDCVFIIDEPPVIEQTLANFYENLNNHFSEITEAGEIGVAPDELFLNGENLRENLSNKQRLELRALGKTAAETGEELEFENDQIRISNCKFQNYKTVQTRFFCFRRLRSNPNLRSVRARRANFTEITKIFPVI